MMRQEDATIRRSLTVVAMFLGSCTTTVAFVSPCGHKHNLQPRGSLSTGARIVQHQIQQRRQRRRTITTHDDIISGSPLKERSSSSSSSTNSSSSSSRDFNPQKAWENFIKKERPSLAGEEELRQQIQQAVQSSGGSSSDGDGDDQGDPTKASWMGWMRTGTPRTPRGVADIKMREALELGGVPRSDRYSSGDWLHNTRNLPSSEILRAVRGPVLAMASWATFLAAIHRRLTKTNPQAAALMCIPSTAHSLMVSALGLLLVFRTNSAYQRFVEGRKIWGNIVNSSRDLYRYIMMYEKEIGVDKRRRVQRLLAAFPFLLRHRVRPNLVMHRLDDEMWVRDPQNTLLLYQDKAFVDNDPEAAAVANEEANTGKSRRKTRSLYWVDKRTLPWRLLPQGALEQCARAQNRPLWVCDRMAQELCTVPDGPNFTNRERLTLVSHVDKLSRLIGDCERIHQTAVPLNYARHSLRALTLWLVTLPFALLKDLQFLTGPALFLVSWLLFGVYEIGYAIEDPFQGTLRLSIICDIIRRDVLGDEIIRSTAFNLADLNEEDDDDDDEEGDDDETDSEVDKAASVATSSSSTGEINEPISNEQGQRKDEDGQPEIDVDDDKAVSVTTSIKKNTAETINELNGSEKGERKDEDGQLKAFE